MPLFGKSRTFRFHPGYSFSGSESWRYVLLFECWGTSRHFCLNECHTDYSSLSDLVFSGATLRERTARKQRPMQRTGQTVIIYTGWHRKGKQRRGKCKRAIHTAALVQCSAYCVFYDCCLSECTIWAWRDLAYRPMQMFLFSLHQVLCSYRFCIRQAL